MSDRRTIYAILRGLALVALKRDEAMLAALHEGQQPESETTLDRWSRVVEESKDVVDLCAREYEREVLCVGNVIVRCGHPGGSNMGFRGERGGYVTGFCRICEAEKT